MVFPTLETSKTDTAEKPEHYQAKHPEGRGLTTVIPLVLVCHTVSSERRQEGAEKEVGGEKGSNTGSRYRW